MLVLEGAGAPGLARRHLSAIGDGWVPEVLEVAQLLTTELVTNAVRSARGAVQLRVEPRQHLVRVSVYDQGAAALPHRLTSAPAMPAQDAVAGRGLPLVEALARRWGSRLDAVDGQVWHVVWFELALGTASGDSPPG